MNIFLTGSTGTFGKAILKTFIPKGYTFNCQVRDSSKGQSLKQQFGDSISYTILSFSLQNGTQIKQAALGSDYIIHTAMDLSPEGVQIDQIAVSAMIEAAQQTSHQKHCGFIMTSGTLVYGSRDDVITQNSQLNPISFIQGRPAVQEKVISASKDGVSTFVLRAVWVYGAQTHLDNYIAKTKELQKIVLSANASYMSVIHIEDLIAVYLHVVENRLRGYCNVSQPEAVQMEEFIKKLQEMGVSEIKRTEDMHAYIHEYGFFAFGSSISQRVYPERVLNEFRYQYRHSFLSELNSNQN